MIVICVIIIVIGSFIYTLAKIKIDEWLLDLSMNRLSLKRDRCNQSCVPNNVLLVEISDDDSFDSMLHPQKNIRHAKCTNVTSHGTADISNHLTAATSSESDTCTTNSLKYIHGLNNDDDVVIVTSDEDTDDQIPTTSNRQQSMFNWNKTNVTSKPYLDNIISKNSTLSNSRSEKKKFGEPGNKRKRSKCDTTSSDDDFNNSEEEISPPKAIIQHDIMIAGTKIKFPVIPYPCQKAVMNCVIQGCIKEQNCLIESPTGSGKTLALLCGVLAWQDKYSEKIRCEQTNRKDSQSEASCCSENDCDDNFFLNSSQYLDEEWCDKNKKKAARVPKIYYGTRTRKQIEQVVGEFRKTAYSHKRMTILSSREYTCIQDTNRDKTELCNELLDPKKLNKCPYYNERNKRDMASFDVLMDYGLGTPWDIEDLVSLGRNIAACPYFAARSLMADAEIIFCPYNYIVDPNIRESMQINLKDDIVILDEAHNIEDNCREAASVNLRDDDMNIAIKECQVLSEQRFSDRDTYIAIRTYLLDFIKFLKNIIVKGNTNGSRQEMVSDYWLGTEFLVLLDMENIGRSRFPTFLAATKAAIQDFDDMKEEKRPNKVKPTITRETKKTLEHLCFAMQMITSEVFVNDYRACVTEIIDVRKNNTLFENDWISTKNYQQRVRIVKLICMNPAVIFAPLARTVRSMILASGTLAPISSFQSELGTQFPYVLNANHIIPKEQVYVRYIPRGPSGKSLIATYENVNSWNFQDELGNLIVKVCDAMPYGVLCFFSSYVVMTKLHDRWRNNGIWAELEKLKQIFVEPKNKRGFDIVMKEYKDVIKKSSSISFRKASGAVFFAVFRGKVAEGTDFKDNEARCVLTVGIPFSNKEEIDTSMKIKYNNTNISKGLLSGSEWYTIHAFRALNQALGRCVRHKNDWGAVLLVDERFQNSRNISYLPKWIKAICMNDGNFDLQIELEDFVAKNVARERGEKCKQLSNPP